MKYKILHISPHLGGGVGRVLLNYLPKGNISNKFSHEIYCLDSINDNAKIILERNQIKFQELIAQDYKKLLETIASSDIILIHWWNHPLLYEFMLKNDLPSSRILIWSHVSGNEIPQIFSHKLFDYPDLFVFTTPMSYLVDEVISYPGDKSKFRSIWSTGGLDHIKSVKKKNHTNFNIGYIGTIDYSKMHPDFVKICSKIDIPNVKFIICGGGQIDEIKKEVTSRKLENRFIFTDFIDNINDYLEIFDVFGYLLSRNHYGTCDQSLAEAMGSAIVPIVLNNNMESYMVHNMYSGIVAKNEEEYISSIIEIYKNKDYRERLALKAKEEAFRRFSLKTTINEWNNIFDEIIKKERRNRVWPKELKETPLDPYYIFLESIGKYKKYLEDIYLDKFNLIRENDYKNLSSILLQSNTKGSLNHYIYFFNDKKLINLRYKLKRLKSENTFTK